jgi:hypothetical protein
LSSSQWIALAKRNAVQYGIIIKAIGIDGSNVHKKKLSARSDWTAKVINSTAFWMAMGS